MSLINNVILIAIVLNESIQIAFPLLKSLSLSFLDPFYFSPELSMLLLILLYSLFSLYIYSFSLLQSHPLRQKRIEREF